jgi:hypothetical protein
VLLLRTEEANAQRMATPRADWLCDDALDTLHTE